MLYEIMKDLVELQCKIMTVMELGYCGLSNIVCYNLAPSGGVCYQRSDCMVKCCIGLGLRHI